MTLRAAIVSCCKQTGWTPNEVAGLTLAQVYPFIAAEDKFTNSFEAVEAARIHDQELTKMAKREMEACCG